MFLWVNFYPVGTKTHWMSKCSAKVEIIHRNRFLIEVEKQIWIKDQSNKPHQYSCDCCAGQVLNDTIGCKLSQA